MDAPTISITNPSTAKKFTDFIGTEDTSKKYINGTAEFTVSLNDKGGSGLDTETNKPKWEILDASSASTVIASGIVEDTTGETVSVNTAEEKYQNKTIIFRVTTWDAAGNKTTGDAKYTVKDENNEDVEKNLFVIDQTTDLPYIAKDTTYTKLNFDMSDMTTYMHQTGAKVGNVEKGASLKFKVYDDDGEAKLFIASKKITYNHDTATDTYSINGWETDVNNLTKSALGTQDTPNKLVTVSSYTFPANDEDCGFYEYAIIAEDVNDSSKKTVMGPFIVRVTQDKATIDVTSNKEYANQDLEVTNTIKISPSEGPYKLYRQVVKVSEKDEYNDTLGDNADSATTDIKQYKKIKDLADSELETPDIIKIGDYYPNDDIIVYYKLTDGVGNASVQKALTLKVDNDAPTVEIKSPVEGKTNKKALTETTQFSARLNDEKAGVNKVYYKFTDNADPEEAGTRAYPASGYHEENASNGTYAVDELEFISGTTHQNGKLCEGKWYLHVYATDEAGNQSTKVTREFDIDLSDPSLSITIDDATGDDAVKKIGDIYYFKRNLKGKKVASDTAGLSSVTFKVDNVAVNATETATGNENEKEWVTEGKTAADEAKFTAGTQQKFTIEVNDVFTKTKSESVNVYLDNAGPTVEPTNPGAVNTTSVTIRGTVTDGSGVGVDQILWSTTQNGTYTGAQVTGDTWSIVFGTNAPEGTPNRTALGTEQGTKTFWFKAIDKLGNVGTPESVDFQYDNADPVITLNTITEYQTNTFTLTGTAYDTNRLEKVIFSDGSSEVEITPANPENAKGVDSAVTWSKTITVDTTNHTNDDEYNYKITAIDKAGKETPVSKRIIVDTKAPEVTLNGKPGRQDTKNKGYTFVGTVDEGTKGSGVTEGNVKLTIADAADPAKTKTVSVDGTTRWTYSLDASDVAWATVFKKTENGNELDAEGEKIVYVEATDKAGLISSSFAYNNSSYTNSAAANPNLFKFIYDTADPVLSITEADFREFMPTAGLTINGTATDTYKIGTLTVIEKKDNVETAETVTIENATTTGGSWNIRLPLASGDATTGVYTYQFKLTDSVGNTVYSKEFTTTVDTTAPTITIDNPSSDTAKKGVNAIDETSFKFSGSVNDTNSVASVYYKIDSSATLDATSDLPAPEAVLSAGAWEAKGFSAANFGSANWSFYQSFKAANASDTDKLPEALNYYVHVYAVDKAGNCGNSDTSNTPANRNFDVDLKNPEITTKLGTEELTSVITQNSITKNFDFIYSASDTLGLATTNPVTLVITKDDGTTPLASSYYTDTESNGVHTVRLADSATDGLYSYTVTAKDMVGKETSVTRNIRLDTVGPHIELNTDFTGYQESSEITVKGTADDDSGVLAVFYAYGVTAEPAIPATETKTIANWTNNGWTNNVTGTSSWNFKIDGQESVVKKLFIRAVDKNGLVSESVSADVKFDFNAPNIDETEIGSEGLTTNAGEFTLSGIAYDTNELKTVKIKFGSNERNAILTKKAETVSGVNYSNTQYAEWTYTFETDAKNGVDNTSANEKYLADGSYSFIIVSEDVAGKTTQVIRSVRVDTKAPTAPVVNITTAGGAQIGTAAWYTTSTLAVEVTASDVAGGTGISTVEYNTTGNANDWSALAPQKTDSGTIYKGNITLEDGENRSFAVRATDVVGNVSPSATKTVNIDTSAPNLSAVSYSYAGGTVASVSDSIYVTGSDTLVIYGNYEDDDTGVQNLIVSLGGTAITSGVTYSATEMTGLNPPAADTFKAFSEFESASDGNGGTVNNTKNIRTWKLSFTPNPTEKAVLTISGKNRLNNAAVGYKNITIIKDNIAPTIFNVVLDKVAGNEIIYSPSPTAKTYFINNVKTPFKFTGNLSDKNGTKSVTLKLVNTKDTSKSYEKTFTAEVGSTLDSFEWTLDSTQATAWKTWEEGATVSIEACDEAKNKGTDAVTIYFDVTPPTSYHEVDHRGKDLYFRLGEAPNDEITSTSTPAYNSSIDDDVGNKYSTTTYGSDTTITFRGTFIDYPKDKIYAQTKPTNSGVKGIYYKVIKQSELVDSLTANLSTPEGAAARETEVTALANKFYNDNEYADSTKRSGYFTPLAATKDRRVFFSVTATDDTDNTANLPADLKAGDTAALADSYKDGYKKYYKTVTSTYEEKISGFGDGVNYLVFVVEDNAGNTALEVVEDVKVPDSSASEGYVEKDFNNYQINVDREKPTITSTEPTVSNGIYTFNVIENNQTKEYNVSYSDKTYYVNGSTPLLISGTADDSLSGVKDVTLSLAQKTGSAYTAIQKYITVPANTNEEWSFVIPKDKIANLDAGKNTVYATVRDSAGSTGNEEKTDAASLYFDNTYPKATIDKKKLKSADKDATETSVPLVNRTFTIEGTSSDNSSKVSKVWLEYTQTDPSTGTPTWTKYGDEITTDTTNWSISVKTINDDETTAFADGTYYFRVVATDAAGNTGNSGNSNSAYDNTSTTGYVQVQVSQDSDRPIITTRSITLATSGTAMARGENAVWARTSEIWGEVWDDDGVRELYVMRKTDDSEGPSANSEGWGTNRYSNGSWSLPEVQEGYGVFFFKVVDEANNTFVSKIGTISEGTYTPLNAVSLDTPKLMDKDGNKYGYSTGAGATVTSNKYETVIYAKVDTNKPTIVRDKIYYTLDSTKAGEVTSSNIAGYFDGTDTPSGWYKLSELLTNDKYLGGNQKKEIWLLYASTDSNGIKQTTEQLARNGMATPVSSTSVISFVETKNANICPRLVKFDVSDLTSGNYTLSLQVKDQAGSDSEKEEFTIQVDNDAPVIAFSSPDNGSNAYGSLQVEVKGTATDDKIAEIGALYYAVTKTNTVPNDDAFTVIRDKFVSPVVGKLSDAALAKWSIVFDGTPEQAANKNNGNDGETKYYVQQLNNLLTTGATEEDLYIWFYAKDILGNSSYSATMTPRKLHVIRYADKPEIEVFKPTTNDSTLGGQITISGSTEIKADKVAKVFIQIDPNYNSNANYNGDHFNPNWYTDENIGSFKYQDANIYTVSDINVKSGTTTSTQKGILVNGTTTWNYQINTKKEFNTKVNGNNRVVAIRVFAVSDQNKYISDGVTRVFTVDPESVSFSGAGSESDFMLINKNDSTITKRYVENDYISGEWYLTGSVKHGSGIKTLSVCINDGETKNLIINGNEQSVNNIDLTKRDRSSYSDEYNSTTTGDNEYNWDFSIPVGNTDSGAGTIKVEFNASAHQDNKDASTTVNLMYDNTPPQNFVAKAGGNSITASGSTDNASVFKQSNGSFKLDGTYSEVGESGLKRIAFYFTRTVDGKTYFIDPMVTKLDSNKELPDKYRNNYVEVTTSIEQQDGLLWVKASGGTINSSSPNTVSVTIPTAYSANIRTGGICKINGIVYRISSVGNDSIELDGNPVGSSGLDVYFALAQIIDNTSTETSKDGVTYSGTYDSSKNDRQELINNGDGDQMLEEINTLESTWQAQINSQNIYDGDVTLTFVYYDKAGNHASSSYKGVFSNNAPRIAAVTVGSDVSGNDIVDSAEKRTFYVSEVQPEGSSQKYAGNVSAGPVTVGSNTEAFKKLKGVSRIEFEIIGGNGELWYDYAVYNPGTTLNTSNNTYSDDPKFRGQAGTSLGEGHQDNSVKSNYTKSVAGETVIGSSTDANFDTAHTYGIDLKLTDFDNIANNDDTNIVTWFKYTIWDQTDGKTKFSNSQNVTINLALNVQVHDNVEPSVLIDNFKWTSKTDNSIYGGSTENGHIDLSSDLPTTFNQTSGEMDLDPKVSGKVVFRGTAWDNTNIKALWAKLYYTSGGTTKTHILSNPYDTTASTETELSGFTNIAVFEAKGGNGADENDMIWKFAKANANAATMVTNGWEFSVDKNEDGSYKGSIGEDGHLIYWTFSFDSQKLADVCANDVKLEIRAVDKVGKITKETRSLPASYDNEAAFRAAANVPATVVAASSVNVPYYQFDVVPYIQKLVTRLDQANIAFTRSAKGNYSVMRGETGVKLYGFNLNGADTTVKFNGTTVGTVSAKPTTDTSSGNYVSFTVSNTATSGAIDVTVNGNVSLNNNNSPTAEYNLEPNGLNNDTLTDNRSIYVWAMNDILTGVKTVRYPSFRIGKDTNQTVAFVYDHDGKTVHYYRKQGSNTATNKVLDTSFSQWYATACAVDSAGNIYGSAQNGDSGGGNYSSGITNNKGSANYKFYAFANKGTGTNYNGSGGAYSQGGTSVSLESCIGPNGDFYAERAQNPKIATLGSNTTKMYTVYYDSSYPRLVFRYGEATNSDTTVTFDTNYGIQKRGDSISTDNVQVIDASTDVGEYAAVGVIPTGITGAGTAVVCWNSENKLMFKYNTDPTTNSWSPAITIDSDYAGEYCDLAVDAAGGIHMAYYRAGNKLKYAYLSSYNDTVADVCMVDSYLSVGENISIETSSKTIEYEGGVRYVPYISYYSSAIGMAKVAWPEKLGTNINSETVSTSNTFVDGVSSDKFTGTWEVQVLPTAINTKLLNYTIGVGEKNAGTKQSVMLGYGTRTGLQTALLY